MTMERISKVTVEYIDGITGEAKTIIAEGQGAMHVSTSRVPTDKKGQYIEGRALTLTMSCDVETIEEGHADADES